MRADKTLQSFLPRYQTKRARVGEVFCILHGGMSLCTRGNAKDVTGIGRYENIRSTWRLVHALVQENAVGYMNESAGKTAVRAHMFVSGRVQGVGYRAFVAHAAACHGLLGGVRNLDDGRVEVEVEGVKFAIEALVQELKQGPPAAHVSRVEVEWSEGAEGFSSFRIWY